MEAAIIYSEKSSDIKLMSDIAKKMGFKIKILSKESNEDIAILNAIKAGNSGVYIDTTKFLKKIRK